MKKIVLCLLVFISNLNLFSMEVGDTAEFAGCDLSKEEVKRLLAGSQKLQPNYTEINGEETDEILLDGPADLEAGPACSDIISLMNEFTLLDSLEYLKTNPKKILEDSTSLPNEIRAMILKFIPLNKQDFNDFFNAADAFGLDSINRKRLELFFLDIELDPNSNRKPRNYLNSRLKLFSNRLKLFVKGRTPYSNSSSLSIERLNRQKQSNYSNHHFKHIISLDCFLYCVKHLCTTIGSDLDFCILNGIDEYFTTNCDFIKKQFQQHEKKEAWLFELRDHYLSACQSLLKSKDFNKRIDSLKELRKLHERIKPDKNITKEDVQRGECMICLITCITFSIIAFSLIGIENAGKANIITLSISGPIFLCCFPYACVVQIRSLLRSYYADKALSITQSIPQSVTVQKLTIFKEKLDKLISDFSNQLNDPIEIEFDL